MAQNRSLLGSSLRPGSKVGMTAGVDYFKRLGRADKGGINQAIDTIKQADAAPPPDVGMSITPSGSESGFSVSEGSGGTPGAGRIAGGGLTPLQAQALQLGTKATGLASMISGDKTLSDIAQAGNMVGVADQLNKGNAQPAAAVLSQMSGVPYAGTILNAGMNAQAGRPWAGQVGSAIVNNMIPGAGAVDLGTQLLTSPALGGDKSVGMADIINYGNAGMQAFGNNGPVDNAQAGKQLSESGVTPGQAANFMGGKGLGMTTPNYGDFMGSGDMGPPTPEALANMDAAAASRGWQQAAIGANKAFAYANNLNYDGQSTAPLGAGSSGSGTTIDAPAPAAEQAQTDPWSDGSYDYNDYSWDSGGYSDSSQNAGSTSSTESYGSTDYGGLSGGADYGWKDGGMVDIPGLTMRYADGGDVMGGMPMGGMPMDGMSQVSMGGQPDAQQIQAQIAQMMRDPQMVQRLLARPAQLMQSGELTPDEVVTMGRVAEAAMFNPALYPQLRQFVAAQGMTPLPPSFDPTVIINIIVISRALQQSMGSGGQATQPGQVPSMDQAQMVNPTGMREGGAVFGPGTGRSDSIGTVNRTTSTPVSIANGEYVIPAHVVRAKGRDFFDGLLRKYTAVPKGE